MDPSVPLHHKPKRAADTNLLGSLLTASGYLFAVLSIVLSARALDALGGSILAGILGLLLGFVNLVAGKGARIVHGVVQLALSLLGGLSVFL
jgi:hypothetical protein